MKICPLSLDCIPAERYCFYFCLPSYRISGNLAFKIAVQKFIHYIQKFIWLVIALILVFHMLFDLKIYSLKIPDAGLILYPLKIEMLTIPLCGRNATIFLHKVIIHIVAIGTC